MTLDSVEAALLVEVAGFNPRQIKRLLNNVRVRFCASRSDILSDGGLALASTLLLHHSRDQWLELTTSEAARKLSAASVKETVQQTGNLASRILGSRGGQRMLNLNAEDMQRFLSATEFTLSLRSSQDEEVRSTYEAASSMGERQCDLFLGGGGIPHSPAFVGAATVIEERATSLNVVRAHREGQLWRPFLPLVTRQPRFAIR